MTEKPRVLFVDDDDNLLSAIKRVLRGECLLVTASSGVEALKVMETAPEFAVLVSDQNMPGMKGDVFLSEAAKRWPMTVRVMLTGNNDQVTAAAAVNSGKVFRFLRKPCESDQLLEVIKAADAQYRSLTAERDLLEKTLAGSVKVLTDVLCTMRPELFQRALEVRKYAARIAERMKLPRAWEIDLAATLYPLGLAFIPDDVARRYLNGDKLALAEQQIVDMSVETASRLIHNIPRLGNVADGISMCRQGYDGSGFHAKDARGSAIPLISRLLRLVIDIVDTSHSGQTNIKTVVTVLRDNRRLYDPDLLNIAIKIIEERSDTKSEHSLVQLQIPPAKLSESDIVFQDIVDKNGRRILPKGTELNQASILRLFQLERAGVLAGNVAVLRGSRSAA